ncbi:MAG: restriction endonuclease subunit S [Anaerolineales bacterium]|jgi:type I restriction enzyme S subunit|nr:restriction endonuclease subunit S [Anaerolineales bacterium]MCZ2287320.1 restriction endonuclease subunit S [Anaerolineales bacterium]
MKKYPLVPLGELGEIVTGSTPDSTNKEYWNGDIAWITPADLTNHEGIYFTGKLRKITEAGYKSCSTKLMPAGSIVYSTRAPIGHCAVTSFPLCTNQGFKSIVPNKRLDAVYGFFALKFFTPQLEALGRGATFAEVNKETFESFEIPLPPLSEQKRIASLLARADRLRGLRRAAREQCDSLLQSVFLEMFGDYLNKIECQFADVLQIPLTNGFFEKNEKYGTGNPIVWVDNLYHTNIIDISALRRVQVSEKELEKYEVFDGDLLFTRSSLVAEGVGQANIVPKLEERTMFESHIIRARVDKTKINPYYALGLFRSQFGKSEIMKRAKTATMTTIGQDALYEFPCPIPPLALQEEFARVVARVEALRARMDESARQGEALFQSLLAESFGGDVT